MRSHPSSDYGLSFILPADSGLFRDEGTVLSPNGCVLEAHRRSVDIFGPSREAVMEYAAAVLRLVRRANSRMSIAATLRTPPPCSGIDTWSVILGADIAFSPTSLDPYFPREA